MLTHLFTRRVGDDGPGKIFRARGKSHYFLFFIPDLGLVFGGLGQLLGKFSSMIWCQIFKNRGKTDLHTH